MEFCLFAGRLEALTSSTLRASWPPDSVALMELSGAPRDRLMIRLRERYGTARHDSLNPRNVMELQDNSPQDDGSSDQPESGQLSSEELMVEGQLNDEQDNDLQQDADLQLDDPKTTELSTEFIGRWSTLISQTNWEKGKIISEWRAALMGSEAGEVAYSDEAWSRRVGGVTPQHVGRLRRVFDRFSAEYESYEGLYWSHFLAALDWDDAQLWLEGAVQDGWSVSQMRRTRWESQGADPNETPVESQVVAVSEDEDFTPLSEVDGEMGVQDGARAVAEGPRPEDPDFGDEDDFKASESLQGEDDDLPWEDDAPALESPFVSLPSLPVDLSEALEQFKLGIIRHRSASWGEVSQEDVLRAIEALRLFAAQ